MVLVLGQMLFASNVPCGRGFPNVDSLVFSGAFQTLEGVGHSLLLTVRAALVFLLPRGAGHAVLPVACQLLVWVCVHEKLAELDPPIFLTEEEIENYKEAFVDYDVDGSGNINILGKFGILEIYFLD